MNPNPFSDGTIPARDGADTWLRPFQVLTLAPSSIRDVTIPAATATRVLVRNPRRVGVMFVTGVTIAGDTYVGPWSDPQTYGFLITTTGRVATFAVDDLLSSISEDWYIFNAGGGTVRVVEYGRQG